MPAILIGIGLLALLGWLVTDDESTAVEDSGSGQTAAVDEGCLIVEADESGGDAVEPGELRPTLGAIVWADVHFVDGSGSKVRPVVVHEVDERGLSVSPMYSRPARNSSRFRMQIDAHTAASFDAKQWPGFIAVTEVLHLDWQDVRYPHRVGSLSAADHARLQAHRTEWLV